MADKAPAYQWYPKDYESDEAVKLMTYEQEGIYRRLLDHQALHGGIPADVRQIAMLCPKVAQKRFLALWPGISSKFSIVDGRLLNLKLERVRANTAKFKADKAAAGRASADARAEQTGNSQPNRHVNTTRTEVSTPPEPASASSSASAERENARAPDASPLERVMDAWRSRWEKVYGYESSLLLKPLEQMQLEQQVSKIGEARFLEAMAAYFATEDTYVRNAKHPLPLFLRDPSKYLAGAPKVAQGRPRGCQHQPACVDDAAHTKRDMADRRVAS